MNKKTIAGELMQCLLSKQLLLSYKEPTSPIKHPKTAKLKQKYNRTSYGIGSI
jgi:hypothetical protein